MSVAGWMAEEPYAARAGRSTLPRRRERTVVAFPAWSRTDFLAAARAFSLEPMFSDSINSASIQPSVSLPLRSSRTGASRSSTSNDTPPPGIPDGDGTEDPPLPVPTEVEGDHAESWALVRRVQDGDGEAFGLLYDRYVNQVFRFVYYRVNDRQLAEDFTSETFLRALRRISTISYQGRDIGAWFMTIARNIVFDHSKSARFRLELTTGEDIEGSESEASPETAVLAHLTNTQLLTAVNSLGDEQKECIVLRFLQGLSVAETAAAMGKNDGAIKALQHRAVKRLSGMLADELR